MNAGRRVAVYGRVSELAEGRSVDEQLGLGQLWAERNDHELVAVLRDDGISASRFARGKTRPDWQKAMELISSGRVDDLWVWEVSRSSRDRTVWAALLAALLENDVKLVVDGRSHDPTDPDDSFMLDMAAAMAVRESALTSKRVKRNTTARARRGDPHGALQFGYRKIVDPNTGQTVGRGLHPVQAEIVREVADRALAREPLNAIAMDLRRRGVIGNRGGTWTGGNLRKMLLNPSLAGMRVFRGEVLEEVTATWPAILTVAQHHLLKEMFSDPERDRWRNSTAVKHLGSGLFRCGREGCGGVMRVKVSAREGNSYCCRSCFRVSRNQKMTDKFVERVVKGWLVTGDLGALGVPEDAEARTAADEIAGLQEELNGLYADVAARRLSREALWAIEPRLKADLDQAKRRLRPRRASPLLREVAGPDAQVSWNDLSIGDKRRLLAEIVDVVILPVGFGRWKFDPSKIEITWR